MGLQEKVLIKSIQEKDIPTFQKTFTTLCGGEVTIDVDWNSMPEHETLQSFNANTLEQIRFAIQKICRTDIGKGALKDGVKKIVIKNVTDGAQKAVTLIDGVLTLIGNYKTSGAYVNEHAIQAAIEGAL